MSKPFRIARLGVMWWVVGVLLAACGGAGGADGRLLVWVGEGVSPDQKTAGTAGQIAYVNADGTLRPVLDVPTAAVGVLPCGNQATSPDGRYFALFVNTPEGGGDRGTLYQVTGAGEPVSIGQTDGLTCAGNRSLTYSPDSARLGYIAYGNWADSAEFVQGTLRVVRSDTLEPLLEVENVAAFHLTNTNVPYISLYTNTAGRADEAAVSVWNGRDTAEVVTLYADSNCRFTSAAVSQGTGDQVIAVMGHRCASGNTNTQWRVYVVEVSRFSARLIQSDFQRGGFFVNARTNNALVSPDGTRLLFTPADGVTRNTAALATLDLNTGAVGAPLVERGAVLPRRDTRRFVLPEFAPPVFSPDGRWLAITVADGASSALLLLDLHNLSASPRRFGVASASDRIPFVAFSADSARLFYVVGGVGGGENTLVRVDVASGNATQLRRGAFGAGVLSPDGGMALLMWSRTEEATPRPYLNLVFVGADPSDQPPAVLFSGIQTGEDGRVTGRRFAYPLSWRR